MHVEIDYSSRGAVCPLPHGIPRVCYSYSKQSQPIQYEVNHPSTESKQNKYKVNLFGKSVNRFRNTGQLKPVRRVNLFRTGRVEFKIIVKTESTLFRERHLANLCRYPQSTNLSQIANRKSQIGAQIPMIVNSIYTIYIIINI